MTAMSTPLTRISMLTAQQAAINDLVLPAYKKDVVTITCDNFNDTDGYFAYLIARLVTPSDATDIILYSAALASIKHMRRSRGMSPQANIKVTA